MANLPFTDAMSRKLAKMTFIRLDLKSSISGLKSAFDVKSFIESVPVTGSPFDLSDKIKSPVFTVMYNPESFTRKLKKEVSNKDQSGPGNKTESEQIKLLNDELSFKLFFDATGASPSAGIAGKTISSALAGAANGVDILIEQFKKTVFDTDNGTHTGGHVLIIWGVNRFMGRVTSMTINYKLFDRVGRPIRAEVDVTVLEDDPTERMKLKDIFNSPDVTKTYTVKAGDTLPLLAQKMYDDESLYLEIARINGLRNYRKLSPGQVLVFPPIKKEDL
ncbi:MAG: LysM peptidoglycan-binding domain-containing protein [Bacteroidetes bacterium]|nr:LysM peptidoglycan-binding domain-containing protein [Bacteroidota bacterium]